MEREEMVLDAVRELYQDFDLVVCLAKNSNVLKKKLFLSYVSYLHHPMAI